MKTTEHIEFLLRQGKKPRELVDLGFPKHVITRVQRQLRVEKAARRAKAAGKEREVNSRAQPAAPSGGDMAAIEKKVVSLEGDLSKLESRIEFHEAAHAESTSLEDLEERLEGTPALGLRQRFKCDCGADGFVAIRVQCTKCGKEAWWGWFPK